MTRPRLLLIHVGRHKTGTTAVQEQLQRLRRPLQRRGILVPHTGLHQQQHLLFPAVLVPGHPALPPGPSPDLDTLLGQLDDEWKRSNSLCCLLSSEVFCELAYRQPAEAHALLLKLKLIADELCLLQVVRPLRDFVLSSVKHQLRNDHLLERSPLSWANHCRSKQEALDFFWLNSGITLCTMPYNSLNVVPNLLQRVLREADQLRTWPGLCRQLQAQIETRPNADELPEVFYAAQFVQIVRSLCYGRSPIGMSVLVRQVGHQLRSLAPGSLEYLVDLPHQPTIAGDWELVQQMKVWQQLKPILETL